MIRAQYNKILREAFENTIDVLGYAGKALLIEDLENIGAYSKYDDRYLSLWKIGNGLKRLFGEEIAQMIMETVMIRMDKLHTLQGIVDAFRDVNYR